jgi:hypothetical protein
VTRVPVQRGPCARVTQPANGPRRKRDPRASSTCKNVPELLGIYSELQSTISLVYGFTAAPSPFSFFTTAMSPGTHARTSAGTGLPRRCHSSLQGLATGPMITSMTMHGVWKRYGEQGRHPRLPPRRWSLTCDGRSVPMSHSENGTNQIASELKALPTKTIEVMVWPKKARAELATCAPMRRRRMAMAWLCQGLLYGDRA